MPICSMAGLSLCASSAFVDCGAETLPRNEERSAASSYLPEAFAADPDRLARFQREAQVLASLNHPGIDAAIYELEDANEARAPPPPPRGGGGGGALASDGQTVELACAVAKGLDRNSQLLQDGDPQVGQRRPLRIPDVAAALEPGFRPSYQRDR